MTSHSMPCPHRQSAYHVMECSPQLVYGSPSTVMMLVALLEPLATVIVSTADVTLDTSLTRACLRQRHVPVDLPAHEQHRALASDQSSTLCCCNMCSSCAHAGRQGRTLCSPRWQMTLPMACYTRLLHCTSSKHRICGHEQPSARLCEVKFEHGDAR